MSHQVSTHKKGVRPMKRIPIFYRIMRAPYNGELSEDVLLTAAELDSRHKAKHPLPFPGCTVGPDNSPVARDYQTDADHESIIAAGFSAHPQGAPDIYWMEGSEHSDPDGWTGWRLIRR